MRIKIAKKRDIQTYYPIKKRELYKEDKVTLSLRELKEVIDNSVSINSKEAAIKAIEAIKIVDGTKYVWILATSNEILQVGEVESHRLKDELITDVEDMYSNEEFLIDVVNDDVNLVSMDTTFYSNTYWVRDDEDIGKNKSKFLYRKIREEYSKLSFCFINVDAYLSIETSGNAIEDQMVSMTKSYFAESKIAFESQAKYWNVFYSGVGYKALELFRKQSEEERKERKESRKTSI